MSDKKRPWPDEKEERDNFDGPLTFAEVFERDFESCQLEDIRESEKSSTGGAK
jgi:hypothetical protein